MENITPVEHRENQASVIAALEAIQAALEGSVVSQGYFDVTYMLPVDFDGADVQELKGHPTLRGRVMDIALVEISEALDSAAETIVVGNAGDADCYALTAAIGTASIGDSKHPVVTQGVTSIIPAGEDILITNTTAGSTGIGKIALTIRWFP
jgi:hypothetical protein